MSEENKNKPVLTELVGKALSKLKSKQQIAQQLRRTGELEKLRAERIAKGAPAWSILRYKHIFSPEDTPLITPPQNYTTPGAFEAHLNYLTFDCNPMPLAELLRCVHFNEPLPNRPVALTFDCGHADFFLNALPLLLKYQVPATVCLPTAYIGSDSFFYDDRLRIALLALQKVSQPLPEFEFLPADIYSKIREFSPKLEINDAVINKFIALLWHCDEWTRGRVLASFVKELGESVELPQFEDFLRWEDVHAMSERGVTFASMGHAHVSALGVTTDDFKNDVARSLQTFVDQKLPLEKYFCLVDGAYSPEVLDALSEVSYLYALSIGEVPALSEQKTKTKVLNRVPVYEAGAPSTDIFACRVWGIEAEGHVF